MRKNDTAHSIWMLKQRFNEIKKGIIKREQTNPDSPLIPTLQTQNFPSTPPQSPVQLPLQHSNPQKTDFLIQNLQSRLNYLQIKNKNLKSQLKNSQNSRIQLQQQIQELKETIRNQNVKITLLQQQNQSFKSKTSEFSANKKVQRPQSCMRNSMSPVKNLRVAFSKDLIKVVHIQQEDCPNQVLKKTEQQEIQKIKSKSPQIRKANTESLKWYQRIGNSGRSPLRGNSRTTALQEKRALLNSLNQTQGEFHFSSYYQERSKRLASRMMDLEQQRIK